MSFDRHERGPPRFGRAARRLSALLLASAVFVLTLGLSRLQAAEPALVVLPYACTVERGQVRLELSEPRSYRVLGTRQQHGLRLCAGAGPASCRTIAVHRFAFDCAGARVDWIDAAAVALRGRPWRGTLRNGQLILRPSFAREGREAAEIALRPGFAPAPGIIFRADASAPEPSSVPGVVRVASGGPSLEDVVGAAIPTVREGRGAIPGEERTPAEAAPDDASASRDLASASASPVMGQGWTATVTVEDASTSWLRSPFSSPAAGQRVLLAALSLAALYFAAKAFAARSRMLAEPQAIPAQAFPVEEAAAQAAPAQSIPAQPLPARDGPPPLPVTLPPSPAAVSREPERSAEPTPPPPPPRAWSFGNGSVAGGTGKRPGSAITAGDAAAQGDTTAWNAVLEMQETAEAMLGLVRQMVDDHVSDAELQAMLNADIEAIARRLGGADLGGALASGRLDLVHPIFAEALRDLERVRTLARIEHERSLRPTREADASPGSREEACAFLGINPRAGEAVAKKVVDALRQSWHPDLAGDETDRRLREERIKRINAAWDLVKAG